MKQLPLLLFLFISCTANNKNQDSGLPMISPTKFSSTEIEFSNLVDTVEFIQLDDSVILRTYRNIVFVDSFIFGKTKYGFFKYNIAGSFLGKIGNIGDGPNEYLDYSSMEIDKDNKIVYVLSPPDLLLSYSFTGEYLNRTHIQFPGTIFSYPAYFCVQKGLLYFFYSNSGVIGENTCYWLVTNKDGSIINSHKGEHIVLPTGDKYISYANYYSMLNDSTTLYWDLFNDTIFHVSAYQVKAAYLWSKGDFRLLETDDPLNPPHNRIRCISMVETKRYLFLEFVHLTLSHNTYVFLYDRQKNSLNRLRSDLIYETEKRLSLKNHYYGFVKMKGRDYLYTFVKVADVADIPGALPWGVDPDDPEGNPVIALIRLKE